MKFYYYAILSITYLWGVVVAHRDASMRSMQDIELPLTGDFSVVIQGESNFAPGKFCNVNGGKGNEAGTDLFNEPDFESDYAIIGGGLENIAGSRFSTITGGTKNSVSRGKKNNLKHSTISGGNSNGISDSFISSVITGGAFNRVDLSSESGASTGCTISGGTNNFCSTEYGVATGGDFNGVFDGAAVAFGGLGNGGSGLSSTSVGGENNLVGGDFSIGLGLRTIVDNDSSMVINLIASSDFSDDFFGFESDTDVDGQFIVNAESFTFQIGRNRDDLRFQITEDNIQNLIDALENAA